MAELDKFLLWLLARRSARGAVTEIRVLQKQISGKGYTWSGWFGETHGGSLLEQIQPKSGQGRRGGSTCPRDGEAQFYFSLQAVDPSRLTCPVGVLKPAVRTTRDADILAYDFFAVDVDPVRPAGVSATAQEKVAAADVAREVRGWMAARGIESALADSGNGYHILVPLKYRGEAPVAEVAMMYRDTLHLLDSLFSTPTAVVDTSIFNPSRIFKLYGTMAIKGKHSYERPHRRSHVDIDTLPPDQPFFQRVQKDILRWRELKGAQAELGTEKASPATRAGHIVAERAVNYSVVMTPRRIYLTGSANSERQQWRRLVLANLNFEQVYGDLLTGRQNVPGWLECRDPQSPSGDLHPSAGVADGTGQAERGAFHSFRTGETWSVFDYLVKSGRVNSFKEACRLVGRLTGIPCPARRPHLAESTPAVPSAMLPVPSAPESTSQPPSAPPTTKKAAITRVINRDPLGDLFTQMVSTLVPTHRFFRHSNEGVFVKPGVGLVPLRDRNLPGILGSYADIKILEMRGEHLVFLRYDLLPTDVARAFLSDESVWGAFDNIRLYTRSPVFVEGWIFIGIPGWHPGPGVWYDGPAVYPATTGMTTIDLLLREVRWATLRDRAHFVAAMLTAISLPMWGAGHPFVSIEGDGPGAGKTTLARLLGILAEGREPALVTFSGDDNELEKQLATRMEAGDHVVVFDNVRVRGEVSSPALERTITDGRPSFRRLGTNTPISRASNDLLLVLTMNGSALGEDLNRRALRVVLKRGGGQPTWKETDIIGFARTHRLELLAELAGMVRLWLELGSPVVAEGPVHSISIDWSRAMAGILEVNGIAGFLCTQHLVDRSSGTASSRPSRELQPDITTGLGFFSLLALHHRGQPPAPAAVWVERLEAGPLAPLCRQLWRPGTTERGKATLIGTLLGLASAHTLLVEGRNWHLERGFVRGRGSKPTWAIREVLPPD